MSVASVGTATGRVRGGSRRRRRRRRARALGARRRRARPTSRPPPGSRRWSSSSAFPAPSSRARARRAAHLAGEVRELEVPRGVVDLHRERAEARRKSTHGRGVVASASFRRVVLGASASAFASNSAPRPKAARGPSCDAPAEPPGRKRERERAGREREPRRPPPPRIDGGRLAAASPPPSLRLCLAPPSARPPPPPPSPPRPPPSSRARFVRVRVGGSAAFPARRRFPRLAFWVVPSPPPPPPPRRPFHPGRARRPGRPPGPVHRRRRGGGGDALLLEQGAPQRVQLHVVLLAQVDVVLLQHHHLDEELVLPGGDLRLRASRGSLRLRLLLRRRSWCTNVPSSCSCPTSIASNGAAESAAAATELARVGSAGREPRRRRRRVTAV